MNKAVIPENYSIRLYDYEKVVGKSLANEYPKQYILSRKTSIKNQKNGFWCCGCAMATIAEYIWNKEFSESFIYGAFRNDNHKTKGMYMSVALDYWRKIGAVPLADFGITAEMPEIFKIVKEHPELLEIAGKYKITGYASLNYAMKDKKDKAIKDALLRQDVAVLAEVPDYYGGGHAVALDGWDDTKNKYTLQNSYGKEFGDNGYDAIPKDEISNAYAIFFEEISLPFIDVEKDRWSYGDITNMYMNGLINGTSETTFEPERPITREETAAIINRLCKKIDERFERLYKLINETKE